MDLIHEFGKKVWSDLLKKVKDKADDWTPEEQTLIQECAQDASRVALMATAGIDIAPEKAQIDAQLANIKVAGEGAVTEVFWAVVANLVKVAATVLRK